MRWETLIVATCCAGSFAVAVIAQEPTTPAAVQPAAQPPSPPEPIKTMVDRLDLEKYRATIKGLTEFGDRRQGTDRNRAAVDWIERQLKSFGCDTARVKYEYKEPERQWRP